MQQFSRTMEMRKNRLCYISRNYYNLTGAGNKAKTDNEDTIEKMGAINLGLKRTVNDSHVLAFFLNFAGALLAALSLRKGDILLLQYPVKKYFAFLCRAAHWHGAKTIALIHDLGYFRRHKLTIEKEMDRLSSCDYVIASNAKMAQWLKEHGLKLPVGSLGLWDYHAKAFNTAAKDTPSSKDADGNRQMRVVYAGALAMRKNSFLIELTEKLQGWKLLLIGNRDGLPGLHNNPDVEYHSFMQPEDFISNIDADFGLVWDGDSLDTCSGNFGEYLRWNTPHKVSFYLRSGLPVIVWKESAMAPIIEREGVGITIDSLKELSTKLKEIPSDSYKRMHRNAMELAKKLNDGYFLKQALKKAEDTLLYNM